MSDGNETNMWVVARSKEEAIQKAVQRLTIPASEIKLEQGTPNNKQENLVHIQHGREKSGLQNWGSVTCF